MKGLEFTFSKHSLNRLVERLIFNQNKKPNKKQINHYHKRVLKMIKEDMNNKLATGVSKDGLYKYIYADLNNDKCKKYIISIDNKCLVTIINDIDLKEEIEKHKLTLKLSKSKIIKREREIIKDYVYTKIDKKRYLFVVDYLNKIFNMKRI